MVLALFQPSGSVERGKDAREHQAGLFREEEAFRRFRPVVEGISPYARMKCTVCDMILSSRYVIVQLVATTLMVYIIALKLQTNRAITNSELSYPSKLDFIITTYTSYLHRHIT